MVGDVAAVDGWWPPRCVYGGTEGIVATGWARWITPLRGSPGRARGRCDVELTIDTAGDSIGVCVSREGVVVAERVTVVGYRHTAGIIPEVDAILQQADVQRSQLGLIVVCLGPGGYTGLRSGISAAKGLALGFGVPLVGVGRFEAEAWPHREWPGPVVTVHHAGGGEYAWQVFEGGEPLGPARIGLRDALVESLPAGALVVGEVDEALATWPGAPPMLTGGATAHRASVVATLGWRHFVAGEIEDFAALSPIYLREPAIGPQKKRGENDN